MHSRVDPPSPQGASERTVTREFEGAQPPRTNLERETGIEPATNSLEGCDSTTELLPPTHTHFAPRFGATGPACGALTSPDALTPAASCHSGSAASLAKRLHAFD
jgi:hypothetical protein